MHGLKTAVSAAIVRCVCGKCVPLGCNETRDEGPESCAASGMRSIASRRFLAAGRLQKCLKVVKAGPSPASGKLVVAPRCASCGAQARSALCHVSLLWSRRSAIFQVLRDSVALITESTKLQAMATWVGPMRSCRTALNLPWKPTTPPLLLRIFWSHRRRHFTSTPTSWLQSRSIVSPRHMRSQLQESVPLPVQPRFARHGLKATQHKFAAHAALAPPLACEGFRIGRNRGRRRPWRIPNTRS